MWLSFGYSHPGYIKIKLRAKLKAWLTPSYVELGTITITPRNFPHDRHDRRKNWSKAQSFRHPGILYMALIKINILWSNLNYVYAWVDHIDLAQVWQSDLSENLSLLEFSPPLPPLLWDIQVIQGCKFCFPLNKFNTHHTVGTSFGVWTVSSNLMTGVPSQSTAQ